jgi:MFS family permease
MSIALPPPVAGRQRVAVSTPQLTTGTLIATALAVLVSQMGMSIAAVLNGLFQQDLHTTSSQLTWIADVFLVPVTLFELSFGVLGDLFGRKRLLVGGSLLMVVGEVVSVCTPEIGASNHSAIAVLWTGQALSGLGAAVLLPTSLAMVAAGTHTAANRARGIAIWAAALSTGAFLSPLLGGLATKISWGDNPDAVWRWAFLLVAVIALLSTAVAFGAQNSSAPEGRSLDIPGQITIAVAMFALLFGVIQGSEAGWSDPLIVGAFVVAAVFFALFLVAERRSPTPLLRLDLFRSRAFSVNSIVTVIGMFAFVGTAYATSIRLTSIQGFSPLRSAYAFVLLQGFALVLAPLIARIIRAYNPRWALGGGFLLIGVGDLWLSRLSADTRGVGPTIPPLVLVGIGFALALSGITAVAVNTVPNHLAGMASGTASALRDFGFILGPAIVGTVALSHAAAQIKSKVAASPALQSALAAFNNAPAHAPAALRGQLAQAVGAVNSGPLGANSVPATIPGTTQPFNPLKDVAFHALDSSYQLGFVVCGVAALAAAIIAVVLLGGDAHRPMVTEASLHD